MRELCLFIHELQFLTAGSGLLIGGVGLAGFLLVIREFEQSIEAFGASTRDCPA